jgi:hypothetical protein
MLKCARAVRPQLVFSFAPVRRYSAAGALKVATQDEFKKMQDESLNKLVLLDAWAE